jgi:Leucine-rich repeat (LRR) protein
VPLQITKLTSLEVLNMYANRIKQIPPQIGNMTKLNDLSLGMNCLTELPGNRILEILKGQLIDHAFSDEICNLTKLASLRLLNNKIERLPGSFLS